LFPDIFFFRGADAEVLVSLDGELVSLFSVFLYRCPYFRRRFLSERSFFFFWLFLWLFGFVEEEAAGCSAGAGGGGGGAVI
jgi:hypothetical protein